MTSALLDALALKEVMRQGWVVRGHPAPESVAAHSWGVAWLVMALLPQGLDRGRALAYATVHDLAEAWVGDLTPHDDTRHKKADEDAAFAELAERLQRPELLQLFRDYEHQIDAEARFVRQLDRLDMALQAHRYRDTLDPTEFYESAAEAISDPSLQAILSSLR